MKSYEDRYLVQRPKNKPTNWSMYFKITKKLRALEQYKHLPADYVFFKSLKTDSLTEARRLRDDELRKIRTVIDPYDAIKKEIEEKSKNFVAYPFPGCPQNYEEQLKSETLASLNFDYQSNGECSKEDTLILKYLENKESINAKSLKYLLDLLINERKEDNAKKTIYKIKRGISWFLDHSGSNNVDIPTITFNQVASYIVKDKKNKVSGSTIKGHLYGLNQVWERAENAGVLSNERNPFTGHRVAKNTKPYDPFTFQEVKDLYNSASSDLKTIIHAAYVTGARMGELLTCEVKTPDTVDFPCFNFKFKDAGKTEGSTRVVPVHSSLDLKEGFSFKITERTLSRDFKILKDKIIVNKINALTGKPRKLSFHSFRTTLITELVIKKKISFILVAAVTGHIDGEKIGSMKTYINDEDLIEKRITVEQIIW